MTSEPSSKTIAQKSVMVTVSGAWVATNLGHDGARSCTHIPSERIHWLEKKACRRNFLPHTHTQIIVCAHGYRQKERERETCILLSY